MGLTDIMLFIREKNLNIFSRALHAFSMADEEWRVADLLDEEQPIVADAKLAKQIVEVLGALDETNLDVRVPKAAREFAENTLSEWFEIIAMWASIPKYFKNFDLVFRLCWLRWCNLNIAVKSMHLTKKCNKAEKC